jgi:hypothetical protein
MTARLPAFLRVYYFLESWGTFFFWKMGTGYFLILKGAFFPFFQIIFLIIAIQ